ncbi:hypothetical protein KDA23_00565, partial [Candidatus Saccharibacteria bacterium]|nr:hypothetical protein [Candidatus Saccharibacteria bacterium]
RVNASNFTISGATDVASRALTLTNGTFRLSSSQTVTLASGTSGLGYTIPATAQLWIDGGTAQMTSTVNENLILRGKIRLSAGAINVGTVSDGSVVNSLVYDANTAAIQISGGTMTVGGSFRTDGSARDLTYVQSGGTLIVGRYKDDATTTQGAFEMNNSSASSFTMSGGTLQVVRANATASAFGLRIVGVSTSSVTGGTVQLVTSNTADWDMSVTSSVPFYDLQIGPNPSFTQSVGTPNGGQASFTILNNLRINIAGDFRLFRFTGNQGQNIVNATIGGHLYRESGSFNSGNTSTVTFNSSSANDTIYGNGSTISFTNLTLNNTFSGGKIVLAPSTNIIVTRDFTSTSGAFDAVSGKNNLTMQSSTFNQAISIGTTTLTVNNLVIDNSFGGTGVTVSGGDLVVDSTLTLTNGVLNIGSNGLTINDTIPSILGGPFTDQKHIQTSGIVSDKGVTIAYPSLPADRTIPVGTGGNYTPARIVIYNAGTTPAEGTVKVIPVNSIHPNLTNGQNDGINYYWKVSKTGLASDILDSLIFDFKGVGVTGTNYGTFVGGYFVPFTWQSGTGAPANASFSPTDSTMRFTNPGPSVLQGDYTAALSGEFGGVTTYYSLGGSWTAAASWSTAGFGGAPAASTPTSSTPVIIGDSKTINITGATVSAASVYFDSRTGGTPGPGTLNITSTNSHSLGDVSGIGTIILNPTGITPIIPTGTFSNFVANDSGTFIFGGSINYTIPTGLTTYNNLVFFNNTIKTLGVNTSVNGSLRLLAGTLATGAFTLNHQGAAGDSLAASAGTRMFITGTNNFPASYQTYNLDSTNAVSYNQNASQSVYGGITYGRLYLQNTGATVVKTLLGNITVKDSLTVSTTTGSNRLDVSASNYTISLKGHLALTQTSGSTKLLLRSNTVTFNGNNAQTITTGSGTVNNFNNLTINNTAGVTFAANTQTDSVRGTLTVNAGNNLNLGAGNSWFFAGNASYPSQSGTLTSTATTNLNLSGTTVNDSLRFASSAAARSLNNVTLNRTASSARVVVTGTRSDSLTVGGTLTLTKGILEIQNTGLIKLTNTTTPVSGGDTINYVDGRMAIQFPASVAAVRNFPVGAGNFYRPVRLRGSSGATAPLLRVEIIPRAAPTNSFPTEIQQTSNVRFYRLDIIGGNAFTTNTDT